MRLGLDCSLGVGKLGTITFPSGYYVYVGSALNGLSKRISRHKRSKKKLRWHIDYLLKKARIVETFTHVTDQKLECEFNKKVQALPDARVLVKGFGSSDCKCSAHLTFFGDKNPIASLKRINL